MPMKISLFSPSLILAVEFSPSALLAEFLRIFVSYLDFYDLKNHLLVLLVFLVCGVQSHMSGEVDADVWACLRDGDPIASQYNTQLMEKVARQHHL